MHYLDTSVLTSYYCIEERSERVQRALLGLRGQNISTLAELEFYCAVARKVRAGAVDRATATRIFTEFQLDVAERRYRVLAIEGIHYLLAREWLTELATPLRVLDALHLAVASSSDLCLVTADRDLARCAEHFGVECELVR